MIKKLYLFLTLLTAFLCSANAWGEDQTLTVMNGEYQIQYVPFDGWSLDGAAQHNQFLLLSSELTAMDGGTIKELKFYFDKTGHSWSSTTNIPDVTFRLAEVENTSLSSQVTVDDSFTQVYSGAINLDFTNKLFIVTFDDAYSYNGGNLLIDIQTGTGAYVKKSGSSFLRFYTTNITGRAMKGSSAYAYCPKTTFTYEEATAGSCAKPTAVTATQNTPVKATLSWTKAEGKDNYQYLYVTKGTDPDWTGVAAENTNSVELDGLTAGVEYDFYVRTYCSGEDQSDAVKKTFSTSCPAPTYPSTPVTAKTATTATLAWNAVDGMTKYQYVCVAKNATPSWTSPSETTGTSANIEGLTAYTEYDFYVRSWYSANAISEAVKTTFRTECDAVTAPYSWNFDSDDLNAAPGCWDNSGSTSTNSASENYYIWGVYSHYSSTNQMIRMCNYYVKPSSGSDNMINSPTINIPATPAMELTFDYTHTSNAGNLIVKISDNNGASFVEKASIAKGEGTDYSNPGTFTESAPISLAEYAGKSIIIQFFAHANYDKGAIFVDNVDIHAASSCPKPVLTATNVIYNGATITWADGSSENKWRLQYKATGDADWSDANSGNLIAASSFNLTGLTPGTTYQVQAQAECAGAWSNAVSFTPTCVKPGTPTIPAKTTTTAIIQWTVNSGEDEWYLQYKKASDAEWSDAIHVTTNPTYTLTGLEEGTTYRVHVTAGCKEDYTAAAEFDTECEAKGLPYNWGFDALNCWTMENCVSGTGLSGNTFMFKYGYANQYLISPELDTDDKQVTVEFDYHKATSGTETFMVGYSTTTNAVSAFTFGDVITATNTSDLKYSEILPAGAKYIAIAYTSYDQYYFYVDNFSVSEYVAPSCAVPTALAVSEIGTNSAKVTWESEAGEYALEYKKTSDEDWTAATGDITSPFTLSGLTANETEYSVRVQAICGGTPSEWVVLANPFKTECVTPTVTELAAWNENFESQASDKKPTCWSEVSSYAISAYTQVNASAAKDGSLGVQVYVYGTNTEIALLPTFTEEIKNLKISFDYKNYGTGSNYAALEVGYYNGGEFTNVTTLDKTTSFVASGEIEMPKTAPDGARIAFRVVGKKSSYNGSAYIDNISVIRKPACAVPTITAAATTSTGAVVSWTPGDEESQWNLQYREIAEPENSWTLVEDVTTGYEITGLEVAHNYEVQVQAYCDATHQSAWTASTNFSPVCNAPSALAVTARTHTSATFSWTSAESAWVLQYSTDGENWESENVAANPFTLTGLTAGQTYQAKIQTACGSDFSNIIEFTTWCDSKLNLPTSLTSFSAIPACWEESPAGAVEIASSKLCFVGEGEKFIYLPQTSINLNLLSATFTFSGSLEFGYIDAPNGAFHAFASQPTSGVEIDLADEADAPKYIAIRYNGASSLSSASISAISIRKTPTCAKPTAVAGTPGVGSAEISWIAGGSETAWNLQYKTGSADWTTVAVTENPYSLTGLEYGVTYKVRVQAACAGEDPSDWSDEASFTTSCADITALPFIESFNAALSTCWDITDDETSSYSHSVYGGQLLLPGGKAASGHLVKLPNITASFTNAVMTLEYKATTGANTAVPQVGYIDDLGDFQELATLAKSNTTTEARVILATANGKRLALRYDDGTSEGNFDIAEIRILEQVTLAHNVDNTAILSAYQGKRADVTIGRTIVCADYYNTLCLPFNLASLDGTPLEGGDLWAFKYAKVDETTDELLFRIIEADHIEAGKPYFIAFPSGENIENPLFKNVTISATVGQEIGDDIATLIGIIDQPVVFAVGDKTKLFLAADNTFYWWNGSTASQLNSFRAYFKVSTTGGGGFGAPRHGMKARFIKSDTETATGVDNVQGNDVQSTKVLENSQVVIIRNGVKYSVQGQKIQ